MLSIAIQIVFVVGFIALTVLIWRVSKWPRWRIRSVLYGWAAIFLWALLWAIILPRSLRGVMDSHTIADTFPDGTIAAAALFGGWFWPATIVFITSSQASKTRGDDHVV
jgi:4-amino-4-deoxy-L-arabinose transferase-like glycosyltransferase